MQEKQFSETFLSIISAYIEEYRLLDNKEEYLIALSGGADSVALLYALKRLGYNVTAAHCNFKLRKKESDRDEFFCKEFCKKMGVRLFVNHCETEVYAKKNKISIEMAARELRYTYFEKLILKHKFCAVCVGHHKNDNVETFLLNVIRGTGMNGLRGIKPRNKRIIRPFLCVTRKDIEVFLTENSLCYVTDSSNFVNDVQRNKVRLNLIPMLKEINNRAEEHIINTIKYVDKANRLLTYALKPLLDKIITEENNISRINIADLLETRHSAYLLWYLLNEKGFNDTQIAEINDALQKESGQIWKTQTHILLNYRGYLIIEKVNCIEFFPIKIESLGEVKLSDGKEIKIEKETLSSKFELVKKTNYAFLDADKVSFPLTLRLIQRGDRFVPLGMKGSKLVSDFLSDNKISVLERMKTLVLTNESNDILWLVNHRINNNYSISPVTKTILKITLLV